MLSGAFAFGVAVGAVQDFAITNNTFVGNATFVSPLPSRALALTQIGAYGENCTQWDRTPNPPVPLLREPGTLTNVEITRRNQYEWHDGRVQGLTCFVPPPADEWAWPYGGGGVNAAPTTTSGEPAPSDVSGKPESPALRPAPAAGLAVAAAALAALV